MEMKYTERLRVAIGLRFEEGRANGEGWGGRGHGDTGTTSWKGTYCRSLGPHLSQSWPPICLFVSRSTRMIHPANTRRGFV